MFKKRTLLSLLFVFVLLASIGFYGKAYAENEKIYLGGYPAGFTLYERGAYVLGVCDVVTDNGTISPCKSVGITAGDIILYIDNRETNSAEDIEKFVTDELVKIITIKRGEENISLTVTPAKDINGKYRLGVFVRDAVNGIGTITYIKGKDFASLGHPVIDEFGNNLIIRGGSLCSCCITGVVRGERGKAGELRGAFLKKNRVGTIEKNITQGVYGTLEDYAIIDYKDKEIELGQAKPGDATIRTTIEGDFPKEYKISIIKVDGKSDSRNFVIRITDRKLLEETGGIVQGMSGSPIVQNGKLVGAVTHVFINDPTRGFGISIENMVNN